MPDLNPANLPAGFPKTPSLCVHVLGIVRVLGGRTDRGDVVLACAAGGGGKGSGGNVVGRAAGGEVLKKTSGS